MLADTYEHTDNENATSGDGHIFIITSAKTATLDADPVAGEFVLVSNDMGSSALLTVSGNGNDI